VHFLTIIDIKVDFIGLLSPVVRPLVNIGKVLGYFRFYHLFILESLSFTKFILSLYLSYYRVASFNLQEGVSLFVELLHLTIPQ
jgi:hypothetical protein